MNNNFNLDEFEDFLSDSAEQHRMYPSDKVWRNIDKEINGNKRWPALTFGAILTGALITAGLILIHPDKSLFTVDDQTFTANKSSEQALASNVPSTSKDQAVSTTAKIINLKKRTSPKNSIVASPDFFSANQEYEAAHNQYNTTAAKIEVESASDIPSNASNEIAAQEIAESISNIQSEPDRFDATAFSSASTIEVLQNTGKMVLDEINVDQVNTSLATLTPAEVFREATINNEARLASVLSTTKKPRLSMQYYITPSISYRYLSEAKIIDLHQQSGPLAPNVTHGVNNFVTHVPLPGLEIGAGIIYNITPAVRLRTGLQANVRGYRINAYASRREPSTIVLNRGFYTDSLVAMSSISTQDGYREMDITNRYFELSIPVAMDMRIGNWKKVQVFVAAALQPTYQFNKSMYMVSSDYKNYVQEPDLARHFNMNTNLEAFLSYKAGGITWQVGPQIRYQLLPGAANEYPVREHLIDYGFKIGVVKTLK